MRLWINRNIETLSLLLIKLLHINVYVISIINKSLDTCIYVCYKITAECFSVIPHIFEICYKISCKGSLLIGRVINTPEFNVYMFIVILH